MPTARRRQSCTEAYQTGLQRGMPTGSLDVVATITLKVLIVLLEPVRLELIPILAILPCTLVPTTDFAITRKVNANALRAGVVAMELESWVQTTTAEPGQS